MLFFTLRFPLEFCIKPRLIKKSVFIAETISEGRLWLFAAENYFPLKHVSFVIVSRFAIGIPISISGPPIVLHKHTFAHTRKLLFFTVVVPDIAHIQSNEMLYVLLNAVKIPVREIAEVAGRVERENGFVRESSPKTHSVKRV